MEAQSELQESEGGAGGIIENGKRNREEDNKEEDEDEDEEEHEEDDGSDGDEAMLESSIFTATYSCSSSVSSDMELKQNFLSFCCRCTRPISQGRDIYMYRYKDSTLNLVCAQSNRHG
jgi:hypothetical protein